MPWIRGLTDYPHVKKFLRRAKLHMMKHLKTADSKVDWSMWFPWTPALMVEVIVVGPVHPSRQGIPIIIIQIDDEKNRYRRVIWFNFPFCKLTNINIRKYFLNLLDKHFNRDNPLRKNFNREIVKTSYCILNNRNRRLLDELDRNIEGPDVAYGNRRSKGECPMDGRCNLKNVV